MALKGLSFRLSAHNIFNVDRFTEATLDDILVSQTTYRLLPRYVLGSIAFSF